MSTCLVKMAKYIALYLFVQRTFHRTSRKGLTEDLYNILPNLHTAHKAVSAVLHFGPKHPEKKK